MDERWWGVLGGVAIACVAGIKVHDSRCAMEFCEDGNVTRNAKSVYPNESSDLGREQREAVE